MRVLDTSIAIDHLRNHRQATELLSRLLHDGSQLLASEVTRFELLMGALPKELQDLEDFFGILTFVPVNETIIRVAAELARRFRRSHSGIGTGDCLIAATAVVAGAPLLTTNVRRFPMIPGLRTPY